MWECWRTRCGPGGKGLETKAGRLAGFGGLGGRSCGFSGALGASRLPLVAGVLGRLGDRSVAVCRLAGGRSDSRRYCQHEAAGAWRGRLLVRWGPVANIDRGHCGSVLGSSVWHRSQGTPGEANQGGGEQQMHRSAEGESGEQQHHPGREKPCRQRQPHSRSPCHGESLTEPPSRL